jgi:hypothetical protein
MKRGKEGGKEEEEGGRKKRKEGGRDNTAKRMKPLERLGGNQI